MSVNSCATDSRIEFSHPGAFSLIKDTLVRNKNARWRCQISRLDFRESCHFGLEWKGFHLRFHLVVGIERAGEWQVGFSSCCHDPDDGC